MTSLSAVAGTVCSFMLLAACGMVPSAGSSRSSMPAEDDQSTSQQEAPEVDCETYGPIQGIPDPGYCTPTPEMELAYEDCWDGAQITARSWVPGSDEYWMIAKQTWNLSSPPTYSKNDDTLWACLAAYQDVSKRSPGS